MIRSLLTAAGLSTCVLMIIDVTNVFVWRQAYHDEMSSLQKEIPVIISDSDDFEEIVTERVIGRKGRPYTINYFYSGGKISLPIYGHLFDWSFLLLLTVAPYIILFVLLALIERSLQ